MITHDHRAWTYAQRSGGLKLHIVERFADGCVDGRARCGIKASKGWRLTSNVPMSHLCYNCWRLS